MYNLLNKERIKSLKVKVMKWWKDQWTIDPSGRKRTNARVGGF